MRKYSDRVDLLSTAPSDPSIYFSCSPFKGPDHGLDSTRILMELSDVFAKIIPGWPYRSKIEPRATQQ